jgi:apolipoprotein N-acyltransferase
LRIEGSRLAWRPRVATDGANGQGAAGLRQGTLSSLVPFIVATLGAIAMALAFPKTNAALLAPVGAAALFWAWFGVSPKRAFWIGWLAGTVYFGITFWWFSETAGSLIAPFGFIMPIGPAIGDGFFGFALVGALTAFCARALAHRERLVRALVPLGAAAIFAAGEWFRSEGIGEIGVPFGGLGYTQVETPFAPLAAFVGSYGVTFVLCVLGAYAAYALRMRSVRGSGIDAGCAAVAVVAALAVAWTLWPARSFDAPTYRVAAVQGNIPQSLKATPAAFFEAISAYQSLTLDAAASRPAIVLWPETVILTPLNRQPQLLARFARLAKTVRAELVVGTLLVDETGDYNVLYFFRPDGGLDAIYRKRQLVPFAEHLPMASLLSWIPWTSEIAHYGHGTDDGVVTVAGQRFGPIVCWESAFSSLVRRDVSRDGATALLIATDDAWFGATAGPYQHAQIAQMRAIETGRWVLRAASTGVSGIIAPNGRYTRESHIGERTIVTGTIGKPVDTVYDALGAPAVAGALAVLYLAVLALGWRRRA